MKDFLGVSGSQSGINCTHVLNWLANIHICNLLALTILNLEKFDLSVPTSRNHVFIASLRNDERSNMLANILVLTNLHWLRVLAEVPSHNIFIRASEIDCGSNLVLTELTLILVCLEADA